MISSKPATPTTGKPETSQTATRKLVVGRGIVFSGEITSCDCLVVEGTVKANIAGCHDIDIAEGGLFTGSASVESAEIRGRFEGTLNVSGRLLVRATGRIAAEVRYHQIEIERGGEISGHIQAQAAGTAAATQTPTPLPRRA
ncbi:MAG TPA: polymer-forming cytoskeletal protein [Stellaceae bacterium]|nr:polymer-forming cytoskeletal protein [Stellaceae bacterium]